MDEKLRSFLLHKLNRRQATVARDEMEKLYGGAISYGEFARRITALVRTGVLTEMVSHGYNGKPVPLANTYRINKSLIKEELTREIESLHFRCHPLMDLSAYYSLSRAQWEKDLPYIQLIDGYLRDHDLPQAEATAPERSYQLVGDEKWIDEKDGRRVLERLGLWEKLRVNSVPDPLMLAVNPQCYGRDACPHLIVENKSIYFALLEVLPATDFLSLIYGAGWKILSGIVLLEKQLGLPSRQHQLYYFGDIDYEGISIWYALNEKRRMVPAVPFYTALLDRPYHRGKENQQRQDKAMSEFLEFFSAQERSRLVQVFDAGGYYPQEALDKTEAQEIWRQASWNLI